MTRSLHKLRIAWSRAAAPAIAIFNAAAARGVERQD